MWLIRTDANGNTIWSRTYGGSDRDWGLAVRQTSDGGFVLAGDTYSFGGGYFDGWILKTNANGDSLWSKTSGWAFEDGYTDIQQTSDGGYVMAGFFYPSSGYNDARLMRTDANGNTLWSVTYGYPGDTDDAFNWVSQTPDGGFAVAGSVNNTRSGHTGDALLLRTNANGAILWAHEFNTGAHEDVFTGGVLCSDGSYALWGYTGFYDDGWLVKTGPEGPRAGYVTLEQAGPPGWDYRLHWVSGSLCRLVFTSVCPGTHGSALGDAMAQGWTATDFGNSVVFTTSNPLTSGSLITFRLHHPTCAGPTTWTAGDSSGFVDGPLPVELLSFSAVGGDGSVSLRWQTASETNNDHFEIMRDGARVAQVASQGNTASGHTYSWTDPGLENGVAYTYTLISVDMNGTREDLGECSATPQENSASITEYALHQNYPNPFNPTTKIAFDLVEDNPVTLTAYDVSGRSVAILLNNTPCTTGSHEVVFDAGSLPSGMYFYAIKIGTEFTSTKKMMLIK